MAVNNNKNDVHNHPACQGGPHRHEKVTVGGSAGGAITEGCIEHYTDRIVAVDVVNELKNTDATEWRKYIVMSEILSAPRCKRKR